MSEPATTRYAGFWKRFTAYGYDAPIVTFVGFGIWCLVAPEGWQALVTLREAVQAGGMDESALDTLTQWSNQASYFTAVISASYNIGFVASPWQATPGKRFCGIKVVNAEGGALTPMQSIWRHAASGLSMGLAGLGFLAIPFTRQKTALHDMICSTRVVYRS